MKEMLHKFDMKMNEAFTTLIMKYATKGENYLSTMFITNCVLSDVGVHYVGQKKLWCALHKYLVITVNSSPKKYISTKD